MGSQIQRYITFLRMSKSKKSTKQGYSNGEIKRSILNYIKSSKKNGIPNAIRYIEDNDIVLNDKMVTVDVLQKFILYQLDVKGYWIDLVKKLNKAALLDLFNKATDEDYSPDNLAEDMTSRLINFNSSKVLKQVVYSVRRAAGNNFQPWPYPLYEETSKHSSSSERQRSSTTSGTLAKIPKFNKHNNLLPKGNKIKKSKKSNKKSTQKKNDVAAKKSKTKKSKSPSIESNGNSGDVDSDAEEGSLDVSNTNNSQNDDEGDDDDDIGETIEGDESENNNNQDKATKDAVRFLNRLSIAPYDTCSS